MMRRILGLLFILILQTSVVEAGSFCVQHFNTYGPIYARQVKWRTEQFSRELLEDPDYCDVIQFNEVWNKPQIQIIEKILGGRYQIDAPNAIERNGLMSLLNVPIEQSQTFSYPINKASGPLERIRGMVNVKKAFHVINVQLPQNSEPVYFVNTHLHPTSQIIRIAQIVDLFQWRMKNQKLKMILSGDFNFNYDSLERKLLLSLMGAHDSFEESIGHYDQNICTYCEDNPRSWLKGNQVLDYIFYSNISATTANIRVVQGRINLKGNQQGTYSDHYGLRSYLNLSEQPPAGKEAFELQALLLESTSAAIEILEKGDEKHFEPYQNILAQVYSENVLHAGIYWDYFSQYR